MLFKNALRKFTGTPVLLNDLMAEEPKVKKFGTRENEFKNDLAMDDSDESVSGSEDD